MSTAPTADRGDTPLTVLVDREARSAAVIDPLADTSLADLEGIRLLLGGQSVIDWHGLAFSSPAEVERFLRVNEINPRDPMDMQLLEALRGEAVEYLTRHLDYRVPEEVA